MSRLIPTLALSALAALAPACGADDVLVPGDYRGEPLTVFEMFDRSSLLVGDPTIRVGLFWVAEHVVPLDPDALVQHGDAPRGAIDETRFTFPIYAPPPAELLTTFGTDAPVALGWLLAWRDDGDGLRGADEPPIEGSGALAVVYTPERLSAARSPVGYALEAGFHIARMPLPCRSLPPPSEGDCGVPLGQLCTADADCGAGVCHQVGPEPSISIRRCVVVEPPGDGCRPARGRLVHGPPNDPSGVRAYYLPACAGDDDCVDQTCGVAGRYCGAPDPFLQADLIVSPGICPPPAGQGPRDGARPPPTGG